MSNRPKGRRPLIGPFELAGVYPSELRSTSRRCSSEHEHERVRVPDADRSTIGRCHNWQIPSLHSPIKFSADSGKNCFVNFQRAEGSSRFVRAAFENKQGKKGKIDASRWLRGGRGIPSSLLPPMSARESGLHTRARRVLDACTRVRVHAKRIIVRCR